MWDFNRLQMFRKLLEQAQPSTDSETPSLTFQSSSRCPQKRTVSTSINMKFLVLEKFTTIFRANHRCVSTAPRVYCPARFQLPRALLSPEPCRPQSLAVCLVTAITKSELALGSLFTFCLPFLSLANPSVFLHCHIVIHKYPRIQCGSFVSLVCFTSLIEPR